jgi:exopolysaccharide biosynthesis WecB/TagA/CpsF family protein
MKWLAPETFPADTKAIGINIASTTELLETLEGELLAGRGFSVATMNLDHVVKLRQSTKFREAYAHHTYVTADGKPVVWLSRLSGEHIHLVAGSDLVDPLCALAARLGVRVGFLGSSEDALTGAAEILISRHPELDVVAKISPPMGFDPTSDAAEDHLRDLEAAGVRLCFVALGAPKQELFAAHGQKLCPSMGFVSIGAGLDFISGKQARAPKLFRTLGAEWLWRLARDPRRLARRYASCLTILPSLTAEAIRGRNNRARGQKAVHSGEGKGQ